MPRDRRTIAACPRCAAGVVECTYNLFANSEKEIHSWEHRCASCGARETQAFRSDEPAPEPVEPRVCPFCGRRIAG